MFTRNLTVFLIWLVMKLYKTFCHRYGISRKILFYYKYKILVEKLVLVIKYMQFYASISSFKNAFDSNLAFFFLALLPVICDNYILWSLWLNFYLCSYENKFVNVRIWLICKNLLRQLSVRKKIFVRFKLDIKKKSKIGVHKHFVFSHHCYSSQWPILPVVSCDIHNSFLWN